MALAAALGSAAAWWCWRRGYTLYYGDAEAHLNIARRIADSRTPGGRQIGTVWLPLPHLLTAPLARFDSLWQSGVAGVIPSVAAFTAACGFLFASARRAFDSAPAAAAAVLFFALNPNLLYLQSVPMTEPVFAAALLALLWAGLVYRESGSMAALLFAALASNAASLTRYEGWFLIPFTALFFWFARRNPRHAVLFTALAAAGPAAWLLHNYHYWGDALEFYRGPYSARAIYQRQLAQGMPPYAGAAGFAAAARYYFAALCLVLGAPLLAIGAAGAMAALARRNWWPIALLALPAVFYISSIRTGATPVFVPELPPYSRYNTRYALAALPLAAFAAAAAVTLIPRRIRAWGAVLLPLALGAMWLATADPLSACWAESAASSRSRREWTRLASETFRGEYRRGDGVLFFFGDLAGVLRLSAIPLREALHQDNGAAWDAALADPDRARERWALAVAGDPVSQALQRSTTFHLHRRIMVERAPAIEIYRRQPQ
jgi:4-amino-4-deoxy-L-arabinose transferase-like glycosyltransferase